MHPPVGVPAKGGPSTSARVARPELANVTWTTATPVGSPGLRQPEATPAAAPSADAAADLSKSPPTSETSGCAGAAATGFVVSGFAASGLGVLSGFGAGSGLVALSGFVVLAGFGSFGDDAVSSEVVGLDGLDVTDGCVPFWATGVVAGAVAVCAGAAALGTACSGSAGEGAAVAISACVGSAGAAVRSGSGVDAMEGSGCLRRKNVIATAAAAAPSSTKGKRLRRFSGTGGTDAVEASVGFDVVCGLASRGIVGVVSIGGIAGVFANSSTGGADNDAIGTGLGASKSGVSKSGVSKSGVSSGAGGDVEIGIVGSSDSTGIERGRFGEGGFGAVFFFRPGAPCARASAMACTGGGGLTDSGSILTVSSSSQMFVAPVLAAVEAGFAAAEGPIAMDSR